MSYEIGIEIYEGILVGSRYHKYDDIQLIYIYLPFVALYIKLWRNYI